MAITATHISIKPALLSRLAPSYTDGRNTVWAKMDFGLLNHNPVFELLCEIDKWRLFHLLSLQIQMKGPVPLDQVYLTRKGFDFKTHSLSTSLNNLAPFIDLENRPESINLFGDYCYEEAPTLVTSPPKPRNEPADSGIPGGREARHVDKDEETKEELETKEETKTNRKPRTMAPAENAAWLRFYDRLKNVLGDNIKLSPGDHATLRQIFTKQYAQAGNNGGWPSRSARLVQCMEYARQHADNPLAYFVSTHDLPENKP